MNDTSHKYLQIIDYIKINIITGKLQENDKLPSVRKISAILNANPNTVQRAYQELKRMNILYTQRGVGIFVNGDNSMVNNLKKEMAKEIIDSFMFKMKTLGFTELEAIKAISTETLR